MPRGMSENGSVIEPVLRQRLNRVERSREQLAKAWLVDVILNSDLAEVEGTPVAWATAELPQLITDILAAVSHQGHSLDAAVQRAARLAEQRSPSTTPAQLSREMSYLHSALLATLRMELSSEPELFAEATERLAALFTRLTAQTIDSLDRRPIAYDRSTGLPSRTQMQQRLQQMIAASKRYGSPFALLVLDVEGPGVRDGAHAMEVISHTVRGSIRLMDEAFYADEDGLWVIAPNQTAESAAQMAHRLNEILARLERAGDLRIRISAGVVACPEHGEHADDLLRAADTAMWRARATGQPVTVAALQER
jgi:diguanylate cyclase (GGDEF)-like protein